MTLLLLSLFIAAPIETPDPKPIESRLTALEKRVSNLERLLTPSTQSIVPLAFDSDCPNGVCPTVPAGYHSHRKIDGTVITHADTNARNAAAHAGIAYPWYKLNSSSRTAYWFPGKRIAQFFSRGF